MSVKVNTASASTVYHGPSSSIYASVGSVGIEQVEVFAVEKNWFYIEYYTGATTRKRGYVPYNTITNPATVAASVPTRSLTGYADVSTLNITVCTGPGTSTTYPLPGNVYATEGFTRFNETSGSYTYIEYSTSSGTKRGYALTSQLASRNRGVLANVSSSATIYTGPRSNYVTGGGVYSGEYVVILEKDASSWYYIEFNSTSGRKRGYVDQNLITPYSSTSGLGSLKTFQNAASIQQNVYVYAGPNLGFASIGSLSADETVFRIEGVTAESAYSFIEYTTSSGQKRGYVSASGLQTLTGAVATIANADTVYLGPSDINYASVGSVSQNDPVLVLGKEKSWFYIHYPTSSNKKRGYVPYDYLNDPSTVAAGVSERTFTGCADATNQDLTVYTGPSNNYTASGTVYSGEGVTRFNESQNGFTYIEFSSPSGTKRGYVDTTQLADRNRGVLAEVTSTPSTVYCGPDETYFLSGGVSLEEFVVILERDISSIYPTQWYHIEYNTASGRKRGYVNQNCLTATGSLSSVPALRTGIGLAKAVGNQTVYTGPNTNFTTIGTIFDNERVSILSSASVESAYAYIEYNTGGSASKRGYVSTGVLQSTSVTLPTISIANVVEGTYGTSGNNRSLKYYKIGSGNNVLAAVFAVHGFEDAWAADGEELVKIAKTTIEELAAENLSAWTIYVIPCANPDGILDGWTNNGPGRATVSAGKDINRSFPYTNNNDFYPYTNTRNFNGSSALGSAEVLALSQVLLQWKSEAQTMVLLDVHGWLNESLGDTAIGQCFQNQFGSTFSLSTLSSSAKGYVSLWGQNNGMRAALIELPFPSSPQDILDRDFAGKFVSATCNMLNAIASSVAVTGVTVSPSQVTLAYNQTQQLTATVSPSDAANKAVIWSSNNTNVATVSSTGLITAGAASGTATITVRTVDGSFTANSAVTVASASIPVTGVSVNPTSVSLDAGDTQQLTAAVVPANATNKAVTWSCSNQNASVSSTGLVTAQLAGTATITVTTNDGGFTATTAVTVSDNGGVPVGYKTYKVGATLPSGSPFAGWAVGQGFNDKETNNHGHLGYDINLGTDVGPNVKPIFGGTVVFVRSDNSTWNGRIVVIEHNLTGVRKFYSSYSHLNTTSVSEGDPVTTSTIIGTMGGSANGSDGTFGPHVHLCTYTKSSYDTDPMGYCGALDQVKQLHLLTFEQAAGNYYNNYYYGGDTSKFPRCGGCCFYDPFGIVSTNGQIIEAFHP
ncbi:hypothetical protein UNSWDHB_2944 [Dehalobacter sp. UNSWDHB]|jgi:Bacterial surface proteins containing Ig-like domains|uniref:Ig-like domain-containing protein n=1 Tax=unclassified Dehalobacter TaxID=2635733 RepID=UPI00028A71CB|nr:MULTISPECIES: Ig-like domain-containing protein [unclassified Dehalobacter]AFV01718.1 Ig domain protein, group 2 domain protein [Dehalobacter sp. DCA]AFV04756.1 Ig domain protein, group 2 domain protein [Dehalobacter sp. CF]EQB22762.1 hypothetical protein UNSWDHB_2944 [Dehalobacter sp. UNSWDHB]